MPAISIIIFAACYVLIIFDILGRWDHKSGLIYKLYWIILRITESGSKWGAQGPEYILGTSKNLYQFHLLTVLFSTYSNFNLLPLYTTQWTMLMDYSANSTS